MEKPYSIVAQIHLSIKANSPKEAWQIFEGKLDSIDPFNAYKRLRIFVAVTGEQCDPDDDGQEAAIIKPGAAE